MVQGILRFPVIRRRTIQLKHDLYNKSSGLKRRTNQIFFSVRTIAVLQRKKELYSVVVFAATWFPALSVSLRLLVMRNWRSTCFQNMTNVSFLVISVIPQLREGLKWRLTKTNTKKSSAKNAGKVFLITVPQVTKQMFGGNLQMWEVCEVLQDKGQIKNSHWEWKLFNFVWSLWQTFQNCWLHGKSHEINSPNSGKCC